MGWETLYKWLLYAPSSLERPGVNPPDYPRPRISVLTGCRLLARAYKDAHGQHIVGDLEEPRSLMPTI